MLWSMFAYDIRGAGDIVLIVPNYNGSSYRKNNPNISFNFWFPIPIRLNQWYVY